MSTAKKTIIELHRDSVEQFHEKAKFPIALVLDNVRSLNNIGSMLRTSDAFAVERVELCGITATPPSPEIHKTALGAEMSVNWHYHATTLQAVEQLRAEGWTVCAIEQAHNSVSLESFQVQPDKKYALIMGHEVYGVDQAVVDAADFCIELPQYGTKHSLNVAVTAGIAIWHFAQPSIRRS